ncbi:hypothetical protein ACFW2T_05835 [Streptomyces sp. NPDC058892]|uniref:hypothetical protein n=1 Tax=unclassified Streptomyces TaxID=2593676 RepID=UPI0036983D83
MASIRERLGATSRFEAGLKAAERGGAGSRMITNGGGRFHLVAETASDLRLLRVGTTGFEPATP